jgi:hypothetical protein
MPKSDLEILSHVDSERHDGHLRKRQGDNGLLASMSSIGCGLGGVDRDSNQSESNFDGLLRIKDYIPNMEFDQIRTKVDEVGKSVAERTEATRALVAEKTDATRQYVADAGSKAMHGLEEFGERSKERVHKASIAFKSFVGSSKEAEAFKIEIDNEFITSGYRINHTSCCRALKSLFTCHNESVNVWSHLLGAIFFFLLLLGLLIWIIPL